MDTSGLADIMRDVRKTSENITAAETSTTRSLAELRKSSLDLETRYDGLETSVNDIWKRLQRPGAEGGGYDTDARADAIGHCVLKHNLMTPRIEGNVPGYVPSSSEIDEALICRKAFTHYFRVGDINRLEPTERKSLSSFAFGGTGWLAPPQMSDQVLSCLVDPTDLSGFVNHVPISGASIKFPIDNARFNVADWACAGNCFHNNPLPDLQDGIGELEIRAESLRFVCCAGNDLLADASFPIETWLFDKVSRGFRAQINYSILLGDGLSKPIGLLNPLSGVPICETGELTPAGQFSWQDLVLLAFDVPMQWHVGAAYYMNQRTFALLLTMSTAEGRPLFGQLPSGAVGPQLAGFPIRIASQLPDVGAGSTPVLFGNLKSAYTIADRQAVTVMVDPYSAGFCTIFKWEARLGGASTCPNSVRLLRIK